MWQDKKDFQRQQSLKPDFLKISKIVEGDNNELSNYAEEIGRTFAPQDEKEKRFKLTTSQIRNVLDEVQRMTEKQVQNGEAELLRPKLAYISGRNKESEGLKFLKEVIDHSLKEVKKDYKKFKNFRNFLEAIVAYHKFYSKVKD